MKQSDETLSSYLVKIKGTDASMTGYNVSLQGSITGLSKVSATLKQYNALGSAEKQQEFASAISLTNKQFGSYLTGLNGANGSLIGYGVSLVGSTAKTIGLTIATTALNAALSMGISFIITSVITAISSWVNATDKIIEKADEAKNKIDSINQELKTSTETVDKAKTRYAELAQEVENLGKVNQSQGTLKTDEYEEFLDLSNQLAEIFPQLRVGFDENNNSILNLSGSVNTIVDSLDTLIQKEKEMANIEIMKQMPDVYDGYIEELKQAKSEERKRQEEYNWAHDTYSAFINGGSLKFTQGGWLIDENGDVHQDKYVESYRAYLKMLGVTSDKIKTTLDENGNYIVTVTEDCTKVMKNNLDDFTDELDYAKDNLESKASSISTYLNSWLQGEFIYTQISDTGLQTAMQDMILNFDFSSLPNNIDTWEEAEEYLRKNILFAIKKAKDNPEVSDAISQIFSNPDNLSPENFKKYYEIIKEFFGDKDPITLYLKPQFEEAEETEKLINDTVKNFDDEEGLKKYFSEHGINSIDEINYWNQVTAEAKSAEEAVRMYNEAKSQSKSDTFAPTLDSYKTASESISSLSAAFKSLNSDGYLSLDAIAKIKEGVGDSVSDWDEYEKKLLSTKSNTKEFQQMMGDLTYAMLENKLGIDGLANADEAYIERLLEENDVLEANKVAKKMIAVASTKSKINLEDELDAIIENTKNMYENGEATKGTTGELLRYIVTEKIFNNSSLSNAQKVEDLKTLAKAFGLSNASAKAATNAIKEVDSVRKQVLNGTASAKDLVKAKKRAAEDYEAYTAEILGQIDNDFGNINIPLNIDTDNVPQATKDTKETLAELFDWIEVRIDRINDKITEAGNKASDPSLTWKERNESLNAQIGYTSDYIRANKTAASKYKTKADKVNLSEAWKKKVRDGSFDINTVKDEKLKNNIQEYQKWYNKYLESDKNVENGRKQRSDLRRQKFDNIQSETDEKVKAIDSSIQEHETNIRKLEAEGKKIKPHHYNNIIADTDKKIEELEKGKKTYENLLKALYLTAFEATKKRLSRF